MTPMMMRRLRQFHLWLGMLFAPAILFFAFSGVLQTFDFHETENGVAPPQWIKVIAAVHKKQDFPKPRKPRPAAETGKKGPPQATAAPSAHSPWPLKVFFGMMSLGLMVSTLFGIVIAVSMRPTRSVSLVMLMIGTVLPVALLLI